MDAKNDALITSFLNDPGFRIQPNGVIEKATNYDNIPLQKGQKRPVWKSIGHFHSTGPKVIRYKSKFLQIKRIVWAKFRGGLRSSKLVRVKDGNEGNCHPDNLEIIGHSERQIKTYQAGRRAAGAKLPFDQAVEIRGLWADGRQKWTQAKLGEKYGISQNAVSLIINNKTYKHKKNHEG